MKYRVMVELIVNQETDAKAFDFVDHLINPRDGRDAFILRDKIVSVKKTRAKTFRG